MDGALFSTGDGHFAQGDGEVCVTAVEMGATCVVRFRILKGEAERRGIRWPRFAHGDYFTDPRWAAPRQFVATMGMPVDAQGVNHGEDLNLACRNALLAMLDLLGERGFSREQAYVIASVAVDLRISNVVDVPNVVVSALLPEEIFRAEGSLRGAPLRAEPAPRRARSARGVRCVRRSGRAGCRSVSAAERARPAPQAT